MLYRKLFVLFLLSSAVLAADSNEVLFFNPSLLAEANLETVWQGSVALNGNEEIENMWAIGDGVYILSNKNYFTCLDRKTGELRYSMYIAGSGMPVFKPELYDEMLLVVAGNKIIEMDPVIGTQLGSYDPGFTAVSAVVVMGDRLFMVSSDKQVFAARSSDKLPQYKVSADDNSAITSVAACNSGIVFATDTGRIICFGPDNRRKFWQYNAVGAITASLVAEEDFIYASSRDTNVYKLSVYTGEVEWLFRTGGIIFSPASVGKETVYQFVKYKGLYAIDKASGERKWLAGQGLDILTEKGSRVYVFTENSTLVVMDNETGKAIKTVNFANVEDYAVASDDQRMYLADAAGKVVCVSIKD